MATGVCDCGHYKPLPDQHTQGVDRRPQQSLAPQPPRFLAGPMCKANVADYALLQCLCWGPFRCGEVWGGFCVMCVCHVEGNLAEGWSESSSVFKRCKLTTTSIRSHAAVDGWRGMIKIMAQRGSSIVHRGRRTEVISG